MKLNIANIATVKVQGRNELHLKFNNDLDLAEAYARITRAELPPAVETVAVQEAPCTFCDGRGFYGTPGQRCSLCDGTGKSKIASLPVAPKAEQAATQAIPAEEYSLSWIEHETESLSRQQATPQADSAQPVAPWIDNAKHAELTRRIVEMLEGKDAAQARYLVLREREACAQICADIGQKHRDAYKGRGETIDRSKYYDSRTDGMSDGAWECEEAIRARGESNGIA